MNLGRTVFSQIMDHLPAYEFQKCVARYCGDSHLRGFSCLDQYLAMAFAQLTYRESLRDIEACLRPVASRLYHMGLRGKVSRTTLADAKESHDRRIFADFAQVRIAIARPLYAHDPIGIHLDQSLYAPHHGWQAAPRQHPGRDHSRSGRVLRPGKIFELRRQHRAHQRARPRDGGEVVAEQDPLVGGL